MTDQDRLDTLLDLSLNGEASESEVSELKQLISSSEEMMEHYFASIDHQLTLKQHFENPVNETLPPIEVKKTHSLLWLALPAGIMILLFLYTTWKPSQRIQDFTFKVMQESHGALILRDSRNIPAESDLMLQNLDLVDIDKKGGLWLEMNSGSKLYLAGGSQLRMENRSTEAFQLLKGSLSGDLSGSKGVFPFITRDVEIAAQGGRFIATIKNSISRISVESGQVSVTRLKDGKKIILNAGESANSDTLKSTGIPPEDYTIFPVLGNGVSYYYYHLNTEGEQDDSRLLDTGIVNKFSIVRGDHEGYVKNRPDSHSDVANSNFHILLKSLLQIEEAGMYHFRIDGYKGSQLSIAGSNVQVVKDFEYVSMSLELTKGLHPVTVQTPGIIEDDHKEYALHITYSKDGKVFKEVPEKILFIRNSHPLPDQFTGANIDRSLSARLPLKGNYKDVINNLEAAPIGSPQFIKDPDFGFVCELDGKKDYLVHLPVDQLGMARNYTATAWVKLYEGGHYDQPLFANSTGGYNATLVLLIRRRHPYLAHLHNDTVAAERLEFGKWAHVVFRYHNGEQAIFLDGKLAVNSYNHSSLFSNSPLLIGIWNGDRKLKGLIHDIRIYNNALSTADIQLLYEITGKKKSEEPKTPHP